MNTSESSTPPTDTMVLLACRAGDAGAPGRWAGAAARLDRTVAAVIATHGGVRVADGSGERLVVAFARAVDAVACAIALQRAPLAPMRLRIALHTADTTEASAAEHNNDTGPALDRAERLCDVANGGQTLLSAVAERSVADWLPPDVWLTDLGAYALGGGAQPEAVTQLCHRDLVNDFPPLRAHQAVAGLRLPAQLTSFVGRGVELAELRRLVGEHRLVTVTGTGGVGKTRLALQLAGEVAGGLVDGFAAGVWWVDLAPITDPDLAAVQVARTLGLPDQPGRSAVEAVVRSVGDAQMLMVLDNCEQLRDACVCASLTTALLGACAGLTIMATSREPVGVAGEVTWQVPPLSLADEAVELFTQRARLARRDFAVAGDDAALVAEICRRLDGVPLAIELAATRVRVLSLTEIIDGLRERFELLIDGVRTAAPRQQTLRASVDWSHTSLDGSERVMFRRLAVFAGSFDLDAAHAVAGGADAPRYRTVAELARLVDKSLLTVDNTTNPTRYRMLETTRIRAGKTGRVARDRRGALSPPRPLHRGVRHPGVGWSTVAYQAGGP